MVHVASNFPPVLLTNDKGEKILPPLPPGYEVVENRTEVIGKNWMWGYMGATVWLPSKYAGEPQQPNNVYARPR